MATTLRGTDNFDTAKPKQGTDIAIVTKDTGTSVGSNVWTQVNFEVLETDTDGHWDASINAFKPTKAGWYRLSAYVTTGSSSWTTGTNFVVAIWKNLGVSQISHKLPDATNSNWCSFEVEGLVYFNGTTDYADVRVYSGNVAVAVVPYGGYSRFTLELVREA